jgi:hypothetical protein
MIMVMLHDHVGCGFCPFYPTVRIALDQVHFVFKEFALRRPLLLGRMHAMTIMIMIVGVSFTALTIMAVVGMMFSPTFWTACTGLEDGVFCKESGTALHTVERRSSNVNISIESQKNRWDSENDDQKVGKLG